MGDDSDYLTLWTHFEGRGYDDKNRMISAASILISVSGGLFAAAVTCMTASPRQLWAAALIAFLSAVVAIVSAILVGFFAGHANRNFNSARIMKNQIKAADNSNVKHLLEKISCERKKASGWQVHLPGAGKWLSSFDADKKEQKYAGPIFLYFCVFSLIMAAISGLLVCTAVYEMLFAFNATPAV